MLAAMPIWFLGEFERKFSDLQAILNYLEYWSEDHCT
jgi:hypothetical protein